MTFTQLRVFATVAELGSVGAAAQALGISQPAASAAVAALRADLDDPLFRRAGTGIELTPGGRALAARARELVRLADRTRREVASATTAGEVRVVATAACAEHLAGPLAAFTGRVPRAAVTLRVCPASRTAAALADDEADVVLGVRPVPLDDRAVDAVPFLRWQRVVVAAPGSPLARQGRVSLADLRRGPWLAGPADLEPGTEERCWLQRAGCADLQRDVVPMASAADALAAVRAGEGVLLALGHAVRSDLRAGRLVRLAVEGTPVTGMWWAAVPGGGRAGAAATALQRFLTTSDATSALLAGPAPRHRAHPVRVELWS
ncbi:LysR family transcriptional regulator [Geodermatophilus sp. DSM 44513]|uniref:LysR family transcriptional regulator n=1 Tax=Geodermatophilus sp. DSM 44513 TaxID=1528104 RepID=UPI00127D2924|nr:LysR family transcriptional regulator [Geodermatophilus sp. DSM 44513]WNV74330.1 LysR family transcriptional regulator [Geodermatophilus sp. DSM 44513]